MGFLQSFRIQIAIKSHLRKAYRLDSREGILLCCFSSDVAKTTWKAIASSGITFEGNYYIAALSLLRRGLIIQVKSSSHNGGFIRNQNKTVNYYLLSDVGAEIVKEVGLLYEKLSGA